MTGELNKRVARVMGDCNHTWRSISGHSTYKCDECSRCREWDWLSETHPYPPSIKNYLSDDSFVLGCLEELWRKHGMAKGTSMIQEVAERLVVMSDHKYSPKRAIVTAWCEWKEGENG